MTRDGVLLLPSSAFEARSALASTAETLATRLLLGRRRLGLDSRLLVLRCLGASSEVRVAFRRLVGDRFLNSGFAVSPAVVAVS